MSTMACINRIDRQVYEIKSMIKLLKERWAGSFLWPDRDATLITLNKEIVKFKRERVQLMRKYKKERAK